MPDCFPMLTDSDLNMKKAGNRMIKQLLNFAVMSQKKIDLVSVSQIKYLPRTSASANNIIDVLAITILCSSSFNSSAAIT